MGPAERCAAHGFPEDAFRSFSHQVISAFGQVGASQLFASQGSRFLLYDCVNGQTRELAALKEKCAGRHWNPVVSPDGSMMIVRVMTWHSHWVIAVCATVSRTRPGRFGVFLGKRPCR